MTDSHVGLSMGSRSEGKSTMAARMLAGQAEGWPEGFTGWTAVPGYYCEVTDGQPDGRGQVRSVDRQASNGKQVIGKVLDQRLNNRGYPIVDVYDHQGVRCTRTVHSLQMAAFEPDQPPGTQVRHYDDVSTNNKWAPGGEANCGPGNPGNLVYGTPRQNIDDGMRNNPAAPKPPPRLCAPHGAPVARGSATRCPECVRLVGIKGAELLRTGLSREAAAAELGYASPDGLHKLAIRYGGYVEPPATAPPRLSHRVMATVRHWLHFGGGDTR
jgi:hypothetical protein